MVEFVGFAPQEQVPAITYARVSVIGNVIGGAAAFTAVWDNMPSGAHVLPVSPRPLRGAGIELGHVAVIDFRTTPSTGTITAEQLAQSIDGLSAGADVTRLEKLTASQAGNPQELERQQQADQQAHDGGGLFAQLGAALGKLGKWIVVVLVVVLAIVVVTRFPRSAG